jgi:hypothetical protein
MSLPPLPKASKGGRPFALEHPDSERLLTMVVALAAEVSTLHDKLENLTRVAASGAPFKPEDVESYRPSPDESEARAHRRKAFVERVLRVIYADFERGAQEGGKTYDEILAMVAEDD